MEFSAPPARRPVKKTTFQPKDRVAALAMCWFPPDSPRAQKFPKIFGSIVEATDLSANVFWDLDEKTSSISTSKLELLPKTTPLQLDLDEDCQ